VHAGVFEADDFGVEEDFGGSEAFWAELFGDGGARLVVFP